jgi:hypothetical protein
MNRLFFIFFILIFVFIHAACQPQQRFDLPPEQQVFGQQVKYQNKVDFVIVVDSSSSMQQHQQRLVDQIPEFINTLKSMKMDFHIAVISTDLGRDGTGGQFIGETPYLTLDDSQLELQLKNRILVGENGSNLERGIESLMLSLNPEVLMQNAPGFWRDESLLTVLYLTDEDDKSSATSQDAIEWFDSIKAKDKQGGRNWLFNLIGVKSLSSECRTFNDYSEPAIKLLELTEISGGRAESICQENLSLSMKNVKIKIIEILTDFHIDRIPIEDSIKVWIDGKQIAESSVNGWQYIEEQQVIRFYGDKVPKADQSVVVDFDPAEAK